MTSNKTSRRQFIALAASTSTVALAGCLGGDGGATSDSTGTATSEMTEAEMTETTTEAGMMDEPVPVTVRIENVAPTDYYSADSHTGGQVWITPGAFAVHTDANPLFTAGEPASIGLEAIAEAGPPMGFPDEPGLVDELGEMQGEMGVVASGTYTPDNTVADPNDPKGEVPGAPPIAPGGAFEFDIEAQPGQRLSFASMFVPSNDIFLAPGEEGITLWPMEGEPVSGDVTASITLWDAGTEPNGQPGQGPNQAPAQNSPNQGDDEDGVVRPLADVNDGYTYPAIEEVLQVTLMPSMDG